MKVQLFGISEQFNLKGKELLKEKLISTISMSLSPSAIELKVIYYRIEANKPNLGLTNFKGENPTQQETEIAKNYLNENELNILNRMVTAYLELAELQALNQKPMYMSDWAERLDDFLKMTGREILFHPGKISHQQAIEKAKEEYGKYKEQTKNQLSKVERDFIQQIEEGEKKLKKE